ncbi:MAG: outer membrane protein assembly factor BamD [Deltaproteobacteria bacterium]|nr:outer membrane protein assembly factor BamD [Deltaproteobacteria bacterium]
MNGSNSKRKCGVIFVSMAILLYGVSCAKKPIEIGRENPELEIKKCIKYSDKKHFDEAIECLEIFKSRFPKSQWGIEAELMIGDNYFRQKEYLLAADSYQSFIKLHPIHQKTAYAYFKTGLSYLRHSPKAIDRDQEYIDDAIANFQIVINSYPDGEYFELAKANLLEARTKVAKRHFYIGRFYFKTGEYIASIPRFQEIADNYKDSGLAEKSLSNIALANLELKRLENAKVAFSRLASEYPQSKYISKIEKKLISAVKK